ncbi:MAG: ATPase, T2SS/T4P/T4SS family [Candidatus Omnitrophica bacterium]|nr:ATPase, T2SS/T4P/T4SS family [Candidatus Omnitrophota bacterium]
MSSLRKILTDILIKNKLLTDSDLKEALEIQKKSGGGLSDILVRQKFIKEDDLMMALSQGLGMPPIDLKRFRIDAEVAKMIPRDVARHYQVLPISKTADTLTVAMADPLNIFAIDDIKALTGYTINPIVAEPKAIQAALDSVYSSAAKDVIRDIVKGIEDTKIELVSEKKEELSAQELSRLTREAPVIKITNLILDEALRLKSSDVLIEPLEHDLRIRFRIDGVLQQYKSPPKTMHASLVSRIKVMSDLNIAEHRLPQDGRFKLKMSGRDVDFRVSVMPSSFGEKVALRILDRSSASFDMEKLGLDDTAMASLKDAASRPHGMILVCGPTGCGKTTTLYSILKYVDSPEKNLVTVEDPVEYQLEGVNQVSIRPDIGLTFAASLRAILRQDPDVIMIGEIRDFDTVDIAIKSALTGHLVLSTLHTTTAQGAIVRLINMGVEPFLLTSSLICVMAQRLVRVVCRSCKEKYELKKDVAKAIGLAELDVKKYDFVKGKGCKDCFNSGYSGRIAIAEIMMLTPGIRGLISKRAKEDDIKGLARKEGMHTLREDGMRLAAAGITSIEEVLRVTAGDQGRGNP